MNFHTPRFLLSAVLASKAFLLLSTGLYAEEKELEKPRMERLDETHYRIGEVEIDSQSREIRFPAIVNLREGILEFLLVNESGKVHESLLRTKTSATDINLGFKLLSYQPSKELYRIPKEPGILSSDFYEEPVNVSLSARIAIYVELEKEGKKQRIPVSDWIRHETTSKAMPPTYWVYGGSDFYDEKFIPEVTGDIAAIFITNSALINYPGEDNLDDTVWTCMTDEIPEVQTKVSLIIAPYVEKP